MQQNDRKLRHPSPNVSLTSSFLLFLGNDVKVLRYRNDVGLSAGMIVEIRGIVNKDRTISFGEHTPYDNEFDLASYESMLDYYHGMCKELCCK